jgi:hypothetical protein
MKIIQLIGYCLITLAVFCGCNKEDGNSNPILIYTKGSDGNAITGKIIHVSTGMHQVQLDAAFICAATRELPADEVVRFSVDTALVTAYNDKHQTGYLAAPEGGYEFSHEATAIIRSGKFRSADTVRLTITRPEIFSEAGYLLPVRLTPATQQPSSNFGVIYVIIHTDVLCFHGAMGITGTLTDPAGNWPVTADDGEASNIADGDFDTYWFPSDLPVTAVINFGSPRTLKGVKFTAFHTYYALGRISMAKSADGRTWDKLGTGNLLAPIRQGRMAVQYAEFYTPETMQYLRLTVETSWMGNGVVLNLCSIIE